MNTGLSVEIVAKLTAFVLQCKLAMWCVLSRQRETVFRKSSRRDTVSKRHLSVVLQSYVTLTSLVAWDILQSVKTIRSS